MTDEERTHIVCPACRSEFVVPRKLAGHRFRCPRCKAEIEPPQDADGPPIRRVRNDPPAPSAPMGLPALPIAEPYVPRHPDGDDPRLLDSTGLVRAVYYTGIGLMVLAVAGALAMILAAVTPDVGPMRVYFLACLAYMPVLLLAGLGMIVVADLLWHANRTTRLLDDWRRRDET